MKITLTRILFTAIALVAFSAVSWSQFTLSGEFRPRMEMSHGYKSLATSDQNASMFTDQRTRLVFDFSNDFIVTKLVLQDIRTWGNQKQLVTNENYATSVHEAWAEAKLSKKLSLKLGRQELVYDDHRIFGNVGWTQQARSHDLALIKYAGIVNIHVGLAYNENTNRTNNFYDGPNAYKAMQFMWLNRKMDHFAFSFLILNNGVAYTKAVNADGDMTEQGIRYSQTVGSRVSYKKDKLSLAANFYFQTGLDGAGNDLNAYETMVTADFAVNKKFKVGAGYEILSGTDYTTSDQNNSFAPLYGTNHKFNGFMDYFYVGNHMNSVGLNDLFFKAAYKVGKTNLAANYHLFSMNAELGDGIDKNLGSELDFVAAYPINKQVKLNIGFSQLFAGESMELLKGGDMNESNNWLWVMFTFKPTFFTTK